MLSRTRMGVAGLLGFEALLAAYALAIGAVEHAAMATVAAVALMFAYAVHERFGYVPRLALGALAVVTLARAWAQTARFGTYPMGVMPTFLVPLGFALLMIPRAPPAVGVGLVAVARTWFVVWYFLQPSLPLALANVVGAAGAWLWCADEARADRSVPEEAAVERAPP